MFEVGRIYNRRKDIHAAYNGQRQGGISTPKDHPVIFVFTSDTGSEFGYLDGYKDGLYHYTGEGQQGDMAMTKGNLALSTHQQQGKTIEVFEQVRKGHYRYLGRAECLGYHEEPRPDVSGQLRKAFVFHLDIDSTPDQVDKIEDIPALYQVPLQRLSSQPLDVLRKTAISKASPISTVTEKKHIAHYRSEALKHYVKARAAGICEGCTQPAPFQTPKGPYLECHHIHRLTDGGPDTPDNVAAVCANCHRRAHFSKKNDRLQFNDELEAKVRNKEKQM